MRPRKRKKLPKPHIEFKKPKKKRKKKPHSLAPVEVFPEDLKQRKKITTFQESKKHTEATEEAPHKRKLILGSSTSLKKRKV